MQRERESTCTEGEGRHAERESESTCTEGQRVDMQRGREGQHAERERVDMQRGRVSRHAEGERVGGEGGRNHTIRFFEAMSRFTTPIPCNSAEMSVTFREKECQL